VKKATPLIFILIAFLSIAVYSVFAIFSENREYGRLSLEHYLLTPVDLSQISEHCEDAPRFIYSSADGTKPTIVHLHCSLEKNKIDEYLLRSTYMQISVGHFKKDSTEIEFEKDTNSKVTTVSAYEYL